MSFTKGALMVMFTLFARPRGKEYLEKGEWERKKKKGISKKRKRHRKIRRSTRLQILFE